MFNNNLENACEMIYITSITKVKLTHLQNTHI